MGYLKVNFEDRPIEKGMEFIVQAYQQYEKPHEKIEEKETPVHNNERLAFMEYEKKR